MAQAKDANDDRGEREGPGVRRQRARRSREVRRRRLGRRGDQAIADELAKANAELERIKKRLAAAAAESR